MRILLLAGLFVLSCMQTATAAEMYTVNAGATVTVNEHGICRRVTNNESAARMVPTKTAGEWNSVISNPNGLVLSACSCAFNTWTAIGPTGKHWRHVAMSSNGNVMVAFQYEPTLNIDDTETGQMYISTNGGSTWTARGPTNFNPTKISISDDGTTIIVSATDNGYPNGYNNYFISTNSGTSWTKRTNADPGLGVAVSGNGAVMAVAEYWDAKNLRTSTNNGSSWTSRRGAGWYYDVALSETGSTIAAVTGMESGVNTGRVWVSTNSGSSWTARGPAMTYSYVDMSNDGSVIVASGMDQNDQTKSGLYVSTNGGSTFTQRLNGGSGFLFGGKPSVSDDGGTIASTNVFYTVSGSTYTSTYEVKISTNSGSSWITRHPINNDQRALGETAVSGDGMTVLTSVMGTVPAGGYLPDPGRLYKSTCN